MTQLWLAAAIFGTTEAFIWLAATRYRWALVVPVFLVGWLWRSQSQTVFQLGLSLAEFRRALREWRLMWLGTLGLFLFLGRTILFSTPHIAYRGGVYFVWCLLQQTLFQSAICSPLRQRLSRLPAAGLAGIAFALLHLPNPVLVPGTLVWGAAACLLFEKARSVIGLAVLQVMLSSMLLWISPYSLSHGFRVGPFY